MYGSDQSEMDTADSKLPDSILELLRSEGLDPTPLLRLAEELARGISPDADNRITGRIEPPAEGDVKPLPAAGSAERRELESLGEAAIKRGEIGVIVLAGGMATRFGGCVKALVPVLDGRTFLDLKLADVHRVRARLGARVPFYCMTSFATDAAVKKALSAEEDAETFQQYASYRLADDGSPFRTQAGELSCYATGHGDLTHALRARDVLRRFRERGGTTLLVSNVDNLTATLDPAVIGAHLRSKAAVTVEVAPKHPGDRGGAPARVDGVLQIVEAFRFAPDFDQDSIDVFNTNTLVLSAEAIDADFELTWFAVKKQVEGRAAWQLERLVGELTAYLPTHLLRVERDGEDARFQPIKEQHDIETEAARIAIALRARGIID